MGSIAGRSGGPRALVIFVLRECIWNAPAVLPVFNDTCSLDFSSVSLRGKGRLR